MTSAKGRKDEIAAVTADELRSQLHLKKMVGRGGFAAVYMGTYKGHEVAVKVILAEHSSPESLQVKLLLREGQYMSRCTHRNILKCHAVCQLPADFPGIEDLGHRSSTWALVLEYIGGGSLADLLKRQMSQTRRAYTDYEAYCWIRDIAEALNYLHNAPRPVMHRDIKADNVLLTVDETGRPTAKLMDFGLMAALDGKNPMLRRRSVSAGGDSLGRVSATSLARVSMGGNRNLSAPSVATYYNDSTHEPGKIFYLMDELPAPTVAALPGPAALRRISVDFTGRNAGSNSGVANSSAGPSTPSGMTSPAGRQGSITVASRGNSFDAGGGGCGATTAAGSMAWGPKARSNLAPATPGSFGTLVPLSEEASYHGNTAGYAALLLLQQQQRQQQQRQRRASQDAAGTGSAAIGGAAATASSSLPNSLHGAVTRPELSSGSSSLHGSSPVGGVSPQHGLSPLGPFNPSSNTYCQGDGLASGSVRLRLLSDQDGGGAMSAYSATGGGGDVAIAMAAAARLSRQVPERNGSLVRMSAPHPSGLTPPPTGAVLVEDELPPDTDVACGVLRDGSLTCKSAASSAMHPQIQFKLPEDTHPPNHQQFQQQLRASRPNSSVKLPPIIAVAKHAAAPTAAVTDSANGAGPCSDSVATGDSAPLGSAVGGLRGDDGLGLASGVFSRERRASLHDAVPLVAFTGDNTADGVVVSGHGRRSRVGMIPSTPVAAAAPLSGVHAQVVAPSPLGDAQGNGGGGGSATVIAQLVERESSQRSIGSNRSGTGNGYLPCGTAEGSGAAGSGALSKIGGGAGTGAGTGAGAGGQLSIATLLQGRYEQDFQWVWRLTGQTGSCMYMAPEVFRNMPYNEKVDVFSFGVLMYEVFARTLLLVSGLLVRDLRLKGMDTPEGYAQYVAEGYRPPKPMSMPEPVYAVISACWADDPCARPNMVDVVETLKLLQDQYAPLPTSSAPTCGCVIS